MIIDAWLDNFRKAWIRKDIDAVMDLLAPNVEYWETPFRKLTSHDEVRREWQAIRSQNDIALELAVFHSDGQRHSVIWHLEYRDSDGRTRELAGTYLIALDDDTGLCIYFHHTGEEK